MPKDKKTVSIAVVSRETGIGIDTLRAWERRYGRPRPRRLPSGHRRYAPGDVHWLKRVAEALARGYRPSDVMTKSAGELDALVRSRGLPESGAFVPELLDLTRRFEEAGLNRAIRAARRRLGVDPFLAQCVAPLLTAVGEAWRRGELDVRHEHFLSHFLGRFLRSLRRDASAGLNPNAPLAVLATLPGEEHGLGIDMASVTLALAGVRTCHLGTRLPIEEIAAAAAEMRAQAVGVSVSLATCGVDSERQIARLRAALPDDVALVVGGRGSRRLRRGVKGVEYFPDRLEDFTMWLEGKPFQTGR